MGVHEPQAERAPAGLRLLDQDRIRLDRLEQSEPSRSVDCSGPIGLVHRAVAKLQIGSAQIVMGLNSAWAVGLPRQLHLGLGLPITI